jgi:hypothetical protein
MEAKMVNINTTPVTTLYPEFTLSFVVESLPFIRYHPIIWYNDGG